MVNPPGWLQPRPVRCPCDQCHDRALCRHHRQAVQAMDAHGHVDRDTSARAACDIARQCPDCIAGTP